MTLLSLSNPLPLSPPQASCLAASMRQLVHDYAWDSVADDSIMGLSRVCPSS
ncbi:hypothetical protein FH972_025273 [Carpinus fangiana]|uniref:Uncharacterized protein n=1 Tax=Carpinus fangiana TaxID=176857 RepID=A0A5N6L0K2_9ROSI|nr:hypothetical protein FH972_025273 [Carpinus fangiana]